MRLKTGFLILIAVNILWAAAFFGYVQRSTTPVIQRVAGTTNASGTSNAITAASKTNQATPVPVASTNPAPTVAAAAAPATVPRAVRDYTWQDVTNEIYPRYIANLRAVGCPEKQIRAIVVADVNDLFDKRRLEHAVTTDSQWWKAETFMGVLPMQGMGFGVVSANFDEQRRELLTKILGEGWDDTVKLTSLNGTSVNLSGPVLGALPADVWNTVQEICARSIDRHQSYLTARMNQPMPTDNVELAKLRQMTRSDLSKVLNADQLEEFLLRYSQNSSKLRQDMRGIDLTPDEFRKIFRAIDPAEHQMQLEYGGPEALSPKQREAQVALRDRAIKETLAPERYLQYLATKDPLFQQAQLSAAQYGLNGKAVQPLYDLQKSIETKRTQVSQNTTLTPEQKSQALQSIGIEHQQVLQRLLGDPNYRR